MVNVFLIGRQRQWGVLRQYVAFSPDDDDDDDDDVGVIFMIIIEDDDAGGQRSVLEYTHDNDDDGCYHRKCMNVHFHSLSPILDAISISSDITSITGMRLSITYGRGLCLYVATLTGMRMSI